jgi:hypothetical protein
MHGGTSGSQTTNNCHHQKELVDPVNARDRALRTQRSNADEIMIVIKTARASRNWRREESDDDDEEDEEDG